MPEPKIRVLRFMEAQNGRLKGIGSKILSVIQELSDCIKLLYWNQLHISC